MPRVIRDTLISAREFSLTVGPFVLLAVVLLAGAYYLLKPTPPKRVVLDTGPEQGAYAEFGKRYAQDLKRYGIEVVLRSSPGSRENLRQLRDAKSDVDIAFVQGGSSETPRTQVQEEVQLPVISLGSMFYEPVWIFYREETAKKQNREGVINDLSQLRGLRVNVGERGSGTPGVMTRLLRANLMEREDIQRSNLDLTTSVVGLLGGTLDAVVMVSAPESPLVQMLLQTPGIRLYEFPQAEAYARRYKFLSPVTLPRGVVDLSRNVPPRDTVLVAATCSLVAREDLHPALVQLFVQAASRIHGGSGWIAHAGPANTEFPLARDAERYYRTGPPGMQRYLPFWLANLVDRMWVALFSIAVLLIPLARVVPPLYQFRIRSRIFRWYRDLRKIEDALGRKDTDQAKLLTELNNLDLKAEHVLVPLAYTDELYTLRSHIALVRDRLRPAPPS